LARLAASVISFACLKGGNRSMAPEFPPKLVVLDLDFASGELRGTLEYVETSMSGEELRVCWDGAPQIPGYFPVGGGVAHVYETDNLLVLPKRENVAPMPLGAARYSWQEGLRRDDPWLMLILVLPPRYTLRDPLPVPIGAAEFQGRLALFWILEGDNLSRTYVEWGLAELENDLSHEIEKINRGYARLRVPQGANIAVRSSQDVFDSFLCHNGADKPVVRRINTALQKAGITTWLDEEQLRPGLPWQPELERQIASIRSACVFVGSSGTGPWQDFEIRAFLGEFAKRGSPVIPVLLPDAPEAPELPLFLKQFTWIDLREDYPRNFSRLVGALKPG
jgi:hypothetical protein